MVLKLLQKAGPWSCSVLWSSWSEWPPLRRRNSLNLKSLRPLHRHNVFEKKSYYPSWKTIIPFVLHACKTHRRQSFHCRCQFYQGAVSFVSSPELSWLLIMKLGRCGTHSLTDIKTHLKKPSCSTLRWAASASALARWTLVDVGLQLSWLITSPSLSFWFLCRHFYDHQTIMTNKFTNI